jgi:capsid portal protein
MENKNKTQLAFAGINRYEVEVIPENLSCNVNQKFVAWGKDNRYPEFLHNLYSNCSTLSSIINGMTDFIMGNDIVDTNGKEIDTESLKNAIRDYLIYGVCYLNVLRNYNNETVKIKWVDARDIRSNSDSSVFFYSSNWTKSYGRLKTIALPKYSEFMDDKSSILMIKDVSRDTYTQPIYTSCINSIVTEIEISKYHLNEIANNFSASAIINFNNGVPTDEDKDEIERMINEKFCSAENAGRFVLAFNDNKENAVTIERLSTDDFDKRYDAVAKKTRQDIFTAFRANPNLFGIPTENLGFSSEEYQSSFKLFNRTTIRPIQKKIVNEMAKIGYSLEIKPFTLEDNNNSEQIVE